MKITITDHSYRDKGLIRNSPRDVEISVTKKGRVRLNIDGSTIMDLRKSELRAALDALE